MTYAQFWRRAIQIETRGVSGARPVQLQQSRQVSTVMVAIGCIAEQIDPSSQHVDSRLSLIIILIITTTMFMVLSSLREFTLFI